MVLLLITACQGAGVGARVEHEASERNVVDEAVLQTVGQIYRCPPSVLHIRRTMGGRVGVGTGVLLEDGRVLTAAHVIGEQAPDDLNIIFGGRDGHHEFDGARGQRIEVVYFSGPEDLAIISNVRVPEWAEGAHLGEDSPEEGDILTSVGLEQPSAVRVRSAEVVDRDAREPLVYLGVQAQQGDSGGPVFNDRGELVGLNSAVGIRVRRQVEVSEDPYGRSITITHRTIPATWVIDLTRLKRHLHD